MIRLIRRLGFRRGVIAGLLVAGTVAAAHPTTSWFHHGLQAPQIGPAPDALACGACHPAEYAAWSGSRHHQAWTNPVFQASIANSAMDGWCANCHAPRVATEVGPRDAPLGASGGVDCAVCHVRDGKILATAPSEAAQKAHPAIDVPELSTSSFCAGCHEFTWLDNSKWPKVVPTDTLMQATYSEWDSSGLKDQSCWDCHGQGHRFVGAHDEALLQRTLSAEVTREAGGLLNITVRAQGVAHNVPSGDPFRRLEVQLCRDRACDKVLRTVSFIRYFRKEGPLHVADDDLSIPPAGPDGQAERTQRVMAPSGARFWALRYAYGDARLEAGLPPDEVARVIQTGRLGAPAIDQRGPAVPE